MAFNSRSLYNLLFLFWFSLSTMGCFLNSKMTSLDLESKTVPTEDLPDKNLNPIDFGPINQFEIMPGEEIQFTAYKEGASITYSDEGNGFIDASSGKYTLPFNSNIISDTIRAVDQYGIHSSVSLTVQRMKKVEDQSLNFNPAAFVQPSKIFKAPNNTLWTGTSTNYQWEVLKGSEVGNDFSVSEVFLFDPSEESRIGMVRPITSDIILAVGKGEEVGFRGPGVIRRSTDAGLTWQTVDLLSTGPVDSRDGDASAIEIDLSGSIYVNGAIEGIWVIKKSTDNGATWATVFNSGLVGRGTAIAVDPITEAIYAGATLGNNPYSSRVFKSTDNGSNWVSVDTFSGPQNTTMMYDISAYNDVVAIVGADGQGITSGLGGSCGGTTWAARRWWTRVSTNGGSSWTTPEYFQRTASRSSKADSVVISNTGEIYVAGTFDLADACGVQAIRKSTDSGSTWSDLLVGTTDSPNKISLSVISLIGNDLYLSLTRSPNTTKGHSTLKSTNSGSTWSDFSMNMSIPYNTFGKNIFTSLSGNLIANGSVLTNWSFRRSNDLGVTWTTTEAFNSGIGHKVLEISTSKIMMVGYGGNYPYHLITRVSNDGGSTWATADDYICPASQPTIGVNITKDTTGNIYVIGNCSISGGGVQGIIRFSNDGGSTWSLAHTYQLASLRSTVFTHILFDQETNALYLGVNAQDSSYKTHSMVRKSVDLGVTWTTLFDDADLGSDGGRSILDFKIVKNSVLSNHLVLATTSSVSYNYSFKVFTSPDRGVSWNDYFSKPSPAYIQAVSVVSSANSIDILNGHTDGTQHWKTRNGSNFFLVDNTGKSAVTFSATSCGVGGTKICSVGLSETPYFSIGYWITRVLSNN